MCWIDNNVSPGFSAVQPALAGAPVSPRQLAEFEPALLAAMDALRLRGKLLGESLKGGVVAA